MLDELETRARDAVKVALDVGADDCWVSASSQRNVRTEFRDGKLEMVKDSTARSLAVALYVDGRYTSNNTTDLHPERLKHFITETVAITRAMEPDKHRRITPPALFKDLPTDDLDLVDAKVSALTTEERVALAAALDESIRAHDGIQSSTAGVYDGSGASVAVSSNGFAASQMGTSIWTQASITMNDRGDRRVSGGDGAGGSHAEILRANDDLAASAVERTRVRIGAEKGPTTKTNMVVDARVAGSLIARLLGSANARSISQGRSFWMPIVGEKAFSELLTITDDPLIVRGQASRHFDNEGIAARRLPIISTGRVENLYVDTYYGSKAELTPTTGSRSNLLIGAGEHDQSALISEAGTGIFVTGWLGGNADGTTGDFSLGVSGHLIEDGAIGKPVTEMNVTGNLKGLFARLSATGNDPYPYSQVRSPTLVFEGVDFS